MMTRNKAILMDKAGIACTELNMEYRNTRCGISPAGGRVKKDGICSARVNSNKNAGAEGLIC